MFRRDVLACLAAAPSAAAILGLGLPSSSAIAWAEGEPTRPPGSSPLVISVVGSDDGGARSAPRTYDTINAAVAAACAAVSGDSASGPPDAVVIRVAPGTYRERVVVPSSLAGLLTVEGSGSGTSPGVVIVEHRTSAPYEATFEAAPGCTGLVLRNLTIRHASPSVANNQAVFATDGAGVRLERCDVSSETGSGVVGEGAEVSVVRCKVHDCKTHGVAVYGDLLGERGAGLVEGCEVARNGQDGVLVRGGAVGKVVDNVIASNGRFGVELVDCGDGSEVVRNTVGGSGKKAPVGFGGLTTEGDVRLSDNTTS